MPISVKGDIKPLYGFQGRFSLGDIPVFIATGAGDNILLRESGGSVLETVRGKVADRLWDDFHSDKTWTIFNASLAIARNCSLKFDLDPSRVDAFNKTWILVKEARNFECQKTKDDTIHKNLDEAYRIAALLAADRADLVDERTFHRVVSRNWDKLVIFSDHHMTAFKGTVPNYFEQFNYQLYLDVLNYYAGAENRSYCVVENGDLEDCLLYEPTLTDASARVDAAPRKFGIDEVAYPINQSDSEWFTFLELRYAQRLRTLNDIIEKYADYYELIRTRLGPNRYVRLTGNHDTYIDQEREVDLRDRVQREDALGENHVFDALTIKRNGEVRYLILHGHQFDEACMQHGSIPFAKSLGEIYSECVGWANQGGDRIWTMSDTKRWYIGDTYENTLAWAEPGKYFGHNPPCDELINVPMADLVADNLNRIKQEPQDFVETLLGRQIAWEYFENANAYNAFLLEFWKGDENYKLRHMNEEALCAKYLDEFQEQAPSRPIPKLIVGHSHEPRQNAINAKTGRPAKHYLNSGSAGRYENLIWCVEIEDDEDRIVSWSRINGRLTKITWTSVGNQLKHKEVKVVAG